MGCLKLCAPTENELEYRRHLISDEETMNYNCGYGDNGNGCYYQTIEQVHQWYKNWNTGTDNYYAYIVRKEDDILIGEVNIHYSNGRYLTGIVIEAKYRGYDYAVEALHLLAEYAFYVMKIDALYNDFPTDRIAAERTFAKAGFVRISNEFVKLTKDEYNRQKDSFDTVTSLSQNYKAEGDNEQMELWDIYDKDRCRQESTMLRGEKIQEGEYHLVVHICIFNAKGEMLIQQRQPFKKGWSNLWDVTVGGSAVAGENSQKAAEREVLEEIGYACDLSGERPFFTVHYEFGFDDWYCIERDLDTAQLKLQYEEVQAVKWADKEEILNRIHTGEFIPYYPSFIEAVFQMRQSRGAIQSD